MMSLRYFEFFLIDWFVIFEVNSVLVIFCQPKVIFVEADGLLMLEQDVNVSLSEFVQNLQVTPSGNLVLR